MRARILLLALLFVSLTGCKKLLSFGKGDGGGGGGGILSTLATLVGFEGEIDMKIKSPAMGATGFGSGWSIAMKLKGDKVRMEMTMPSVPGIPSTMGASIMDGGKKKAYTLMPTTKQYVETDLDPATKPTGPVKTGPKPVITKTGRTDKVAGYSCEIMTSQEPGTRARSEICVSKGLTLLSLGMGPFSKMGEGSGFEDILKEGFPLRMEMYDASGVLEMKMEATRIEKKSISDSEFEIPRGYTKMGPYPGYGGGGPAPTVTF